MKMIRIGTHILTTAFLTVSASPAGLTQYFHTAPATPDAQAFLADLICGNLDNPLTVCDVGEVCAHSTQADGPLANPAKNPAKTPARTEKDKSADIGTNGTNGTNSATSLTSHQLPTPEESSQSFVPLEPRVSASFASYESISGGPVLRVSNGLPGAGNYLMVYEAERKISATRFYSVLGLAKSYDNGVTWQDLGEIIQSRGTNLTSATSFDLKYGGAVIDRSKKSLVINFQDRSGNEPDSAWQSQASIPLVALLQSAFRSAGAKQIVYVTPNKKDRERSNRENSTFN